VIHDVELLWFSDCPNHATARRMLEEAIAELVPGTPILDLDATDPVTAERVRFPGSPTIRVDGRDIDPTYVDPGDYTPRCRLYRTDSGPLGLPERRWIEDALLGRQPGPADGHETSTSGSPAERSTRSTELSSVRRAKPRATTAKGYIAESESEDRTRPIPRADKR